VLEELGDLELLHRLREPRVQALRVQPQHVDLGGVCAELRAPFDAAQVADQEPPVLVLEPQPAAVVVLVVLPAGRVDRADGVEQEVRDRPHELVHHRAGGDVRGGIRPGRMIGNHPGPRMVLVLGVCSVVADAVRVSVGHGVPPAREVAGGGCSPPEVDNI
jgi:hypothetical protein